MPTADKGAAQTFEVLTDELRAAMGFLGITRISDITADVLRGHSAVGADRLFEGVAA